MQLNCLFLQASPLGKKVSFWTLKESEANENEREEEIKRVERDLLKNLLQDFHLLLLQLCHHVHTISQTLWEGPYTHTQIFYLQLLLCKCVFTWWYSLPFLSLMTLRAWSCSSMFFCTINERNIWKSSVARTGWNTAWRTKTRTSVVKQLIQPMIHSQVIAMGGEQGRVVLLNKLMRIKVHWEVKEACKQSYPGVNPMS